MKQLKCNTSGSIASRQIAWQSRQIIDGARECRYVDKQSKNSLNEKKTTLRYSGFRFALFGLSIVTRAFPRMNITSHPACDTRMIWSP
jgi:hypothetical protein